MSLTYPEPEEVPGIGYFAYELDKFNEEFESNEPTRSKKILSKYEGGELAILWKTGDSWGASKDQMLARITRSDGSVVGIYDYRKDLKVLALVRDQWVSIDSAEAKDIAREQKEIKIVNNDGVELIMFGKYRK